MPVKAASMMTTPADEATLETSWLRINWLCSPGKLPWTSLEIDLLNSLMDCKYYKVTCIIVMGTQLKSPHILQTFIN